MHTRAATKKAAEVVAAQNLAAATLSSPPITPAVVKQNLENVATGSPTKPRKRAPPKKKAKISSEPMMGGWDVLPHGMGKKGDLLDNNFGNTDTDITTATPKKASSAKVVKATLVTPLIKDEDIKNEDEGKSLDLSDPITADSLEDVKEEKPKRKRAPRKKAVDVTTDTEGSPSKPVKATKKKTYGLTFGQTPFPDHVSPTHEEAELVNSLLTTMHGEVKPPDKIPAPSETVTGCGEVPDVLDATIRTYLSAATAASNANKSMAGLKKRFGLRTSGKGAGSVLWEAVHAAPQEDVQEAIRSGGLAKIKSENIKKLLNQVFDQNTALLEALVKELDTDVSVPFFGKALETKEQKEAEIKGLRENMLTLDYVHALDTPAAMEALRELPGIGVKTASCVALFCLQRPSFAVDTHVYRHCKWLGWIPEKAKRDQCFSHCEVRLPDHLKYSLHQLFIRHGRLCGRCRANTSEGSTEWENTICPIEHLVKRIGDKKQVGFSASKKAAVVKKTVVKKVVKKSANKRKRGVEESDEEEEAEEQIEAEMDEENEMGLENDLALDDEVETDIEIEADTDLSANVQTDSEDISA